MEPAERRRDLLGRFVDWATWRDDVRAAVLVGSTARSERPADRFSDIDIVLLVRDPAALLDDTTWAGEIGEVGITFVERTPLPGVRERRVLFRDGSDVDVVAVGVDRVDELARTGSDVLARGYRVLVDKDGLAARLAAVPPRTGLGSPSSLQLAETVSDFWYHAVWIARKLRRGEVLVAKECLDGYEKDLVVRLAAWHAGDRDTFHGVRFIEEWADPRVLDGLRAAYAAYDPADVERGLQATMDLFSWLARETASRSGLAYAEDEERLARSLVRDVLAGEA